MGYDRKGGCTNDLKVFTFTAEWGKLQEEVLGRKARCSVMGILNLRCLLDVQVQTAST